MGLVEVGVKWGSQESVIQGLNGQGFRVSKSFAMQCFSMFKGTYEQAYIDPVTNREWSRVESADWDAAWHGVSLDPYGYQGVNAAMIDLGNPIFPWNWFN